MFLIGFGVVVGGGGGGGGGGFGLKKLQKIHLYALIFEEYIKVLVPC
jgi:hypothetical protein